MVVDKLIEILSPLVSDEVYRQGSFSQDTKYPKLFITYWWSGSTDNNHYDNEIRHGVIYNFDINVYGDDIDRVYETMGKVIKTLKENKFIVSGNGEDRPSDDVNYVGLGIEIKYIDYKEN